jgi:O-6-methylguanine DNA methyltransferase
VEVVIEDGKLRRVTPPAEIPEGLTSVHLAELLKALAAFPLALDHAPAFTRRVWEHLRAIPWGRADTYRDVATALGQPGASRAVGQACGANPLLFIVPCHRVIAESGLGGFALGLPWKARLLELESEPLATL